MNPLDPHEIFRDHSEHFTEQGEECCLNCWDGTGFTLAWPCLPYQMASQLVGAQNLAASALELATEAVNNLTYLTRRTNFSHDDDLLWYDESSLKSRRDAISDQLWTLTRRSVPS